MGGWDYCESPLVDGDRLIVTPAGKEATMVALDKKAERLFGNARFR
jgi:outer membrane protein assembly factor BamB